MATKDSGIPKTQAQPLASEAEVGATSAEVQSSDLPLNTEHPRLQKKDDKVSAETEAFMNAQAEANELQRKADMEAGLSPEQKAANEAAAKADDLRAKANEGQGGEPKMSTVADAGVLAVVDPKTQVSDHYAQKFGNDPENPKLAPGIKPDESLTRLYRITPDVPGRVYTQVPAAMVGDYERAGWNRDA